MYFVCIPELLLRLLICVVLLAAALLAAAVVPLMIWLFFGKKRIFVRLLCLCLAAEVLGLTYLTGHPLYSCPEEYQSCVSEEDLHLCALSGRKSPAQFALAD